MASPRATEAIEQLRHLMELERQEEAARHRALIHARGLEPFLQAGRALRGLAARDEGFGLGGRALVGFRVPGQPLPGTKLGVGDEVRVVSRGALDDGPEGLIAEKTPEGLVVAFERLPPEEIYDGRVALVQVPDDVSWRRQFEGLGALLHARRGRHVELRELFFGEGQPDPRFESPHDLVFLNAHLNPSQRRAVRQVLAAQDLALVHGPPGTGKTTTLVEVLRQARRMGGKVLAVAASNTAVDNLVERLVDAGEPALRIGHPARVTPALRHATLDIRVQSDERYILSRTFLNAARQLATRREDLTPKVKRGRKSRRDAARDAMGAMTRDIGRLMATVRRMEQEAVENVLASADIVCATLVGAGASLLDEHAFEWVVIDEATQATTPAVVLALLRAAPGARVVLAGDHLQLAPTVVSLEAQKGGLADTLFEACVARWGDRVRSLLEVQYRMHEAIMRFSSDRFYEGRLTADESVRGHLLRDLPDVADGPLTATPLEWVDTAGAGCPESREVGGESLENPGEAAVVGAEVRALVEAGLRPAQIAVIAPYSAQVRRLRGLLGDLEGLEIDTVDGFQGREKEAVVVSLTRSNPDGEVGFLADVRRMNVAWTRARRKLLLVGDAFTLGHHRFYADAVAYVRAHGVHRRAPPAAGGLAVGDLGGGP